MKFQIPDPIDPLTVNLKVTTSEDKPKCTVDWGDGLTDSSVDIDGPTDIEHTYLEVSLLKKFTNKNYICFYAPYLRRIRVYCFGHACRSVSRPSCFRSII